MPTTGGGGPAGTFTVSASGGPVDNYTISGAPSGLSVSPAGGALADGATQTITVTWNGPGSMTATLTVNPGGLPVYVSWQPIQ
jgi:hypothetical protein